MANRAVRRKNKEKKEPVTVQQVDEERADGAVKIAITVFVVLIMFYALTMAITGAFDPKKQLTDDEKEAPSVIQYDEILATQTFNMNYGEYYVMFYDFESQGSSLYKSIMSKYLDSNKNAKIYTVDLSKGINKVYIGEEGNAKVSNAEGLKINGPTVIKINNGQNVAYGEGADAIKAILK